MRSGDGHLFSSYDAYVLDKTETLWIITSSDRSVTKLMLPNVEP
jgi:hypothetical protein